MGYLHISNLYKDIDILLFKECYALEKIHGCLKKGTRVSLSNGREGNIEDIKVGDSIVSYDEENKRFVDKKVLNVLIQEADIRLPWVQISLQNNKMITCTEDHPFLTKKGWIEAKDLTISDDIVGYRV